MLKPTDRVLVAVSGGKDSLAIWDLLVELGFDVDGLYIGLGIGEYSESSGSYAQRFAESRQLTLRQVDLRNDYGYDVPTAAAVTKRVPCSACGMSKRHLFDSETIAGGYDVLVTGHNLDDEAAVLYGNVMRWQVQYLRRQAPVLPSGHGFPKKVKPLVRLTERETAAYCVLRNIDYLVEECPMAAGNKHLQYKEILNDLEKKSPGSKSDFYFGYLKRAAPSLIGGATLESENADIGGAASTFPESESEATSGGEQGVSLASEVASLSTCSRCGSPAESEICAFCRLVEKASAAEPVPVKLTQKQRKSASAVSRTNVSEADS